MLPSEKESAQLLCLSKAAQLPHTHPSGLATRRSTGCRQGEGGVLYLGWVLRLLQGGALLSRLGCSPAVSLSGVVGATPVRAQASLRGWAWGQAGTQGQQVRWSRWSRSQWSGNQAGVRQSLKALSRRLSCCLEQEAGAGSSIRWMWREKVSNVVQIEPWVQT